ncbi:MAG: hypothetical protein ACI9OD_002521 [Limisphaerales bacterium]|jgi:hypothetical protein
MEAPTPPNPTRHHGPRRFVKWVLVMGVVSIGLAILSSLLAGRRPSNAARPRFDPDYRWESDTPVEHVSYGYGSFFGTQVFGDRLWISGSMGKPPSRHDLLFDLKTRTVVGRLHDASPITSPAENRFLCVTRQTYIPGRLAKVWGFITGRHPRLSSFSFSGADTRFSLGIPIPWDPCPMTYFVGEDLWLSDTCPNPEAKFLATLHQPQGRSGFGAPTPQHQRYCRRVFPIGYEPPLGSANDENSYEIVDIANGTHRRFLTTGSLLRAWQDESNVFAPDSDGSIITMDVMTGERAPFLSQQTIRNFKKTNGISGRISGAHSRVLVTPSGPRLCLFEDQPCEFENVQFRDETENFKELPPVEDESAFKMHPTWLARVDHRSGELRLLSKSIVLPIFSDCYANDALTHIVRSGENDSVQVADLSDGVYREIVPQQQMMCV